MILRTLILTVAVVGVAVGCGCGSATTKPSIKGQIQVHPHTTRFSTRLSGGLTVVGAIYPSIPEYSPTTPRNFVRVRVLRGNHMLSVSRASILAIMTTMKMAPIRARVRRRGRALEGRVPIPMFGGYRLRLDVTTNGHTHHGRAVVNFPLP